ncbi:MAG: hypothetical protein HRU46_21180 [Verrucomicrobiales bacterium]|nr:hypothetical protein [Verrucomicrobiales bacterium]
MATLGVSTRARVISRISFYLLLIGFAQVSTWIFPDPHQRELDAWAEQGVVRPLIAVPLSDLSVIPSGMMKVGG